MDTDLLPFLKSHKIFVSLDDQTLLTLIPKLTKIELDRGNLLFSQGEPSDCAYILASGKLIVQLITENHHTKTVGHIDAGETVGELGALSGEPRAMSVKALRDCILYKISSKDFVELCYLHPAVMFATIHPLLCRSQNMIHLLTSEQTLNQITLFPANHEMHLDLFIEKFMLCIQNHSDIILVTDFQDDFRNVNDPEIIAEKLDIIESHKKPTQLIIYLLKSFNSALATHCLRRADKLYIIANGQETPIIDPVILNHLNQAKSHYKFSPDLILLHPSKTVLPRNTSAWLLQTPLEMHHHIRIDTMKHYQRLLRFMRGNAVGLVLGGGGTRGWAHLGVIKALHEQKIPIDMIGGTSVGAIIGGCYAIDESYEESYEKFYNIIEMSRRSVSWRSMTWPIISLFDARSFTASQRKTFNDIEIEDLWLPYYCISSNLANYTEEIHRNGLLWERTRCSSSIPGIIPPMVVHGELHLDGGLFNNLPVDVMRQYIGKKGTVIASELNSSLRDYRKYHFPPELTLKDALLYKLGLSHDNYKFPRFIDTFLRGLMIGSSAKTKQNILSADVLINLNLNKFRLLHSTPKQADKMINVGYLEAMIRIHQMKNTTSEK